MIHADEPGHIPTIQNPPDPHWLDAVHGTAHEPSGKQIAPSVDKTQLQLLGEVVDGHLLKFG
jgi:hypothetical protein